MFLNRPKPWYGKNKPRFRPLTLEEAIINLGFFY